jgi:hypothetical protein
MTGEFIHGRGEEGLRASGSVNIDAIGDDEE